MKLAHWALLAFVVGALLVTLSGSGCQETNEGPTPAQPERPKRDLPAAVLAGQEFEVSVTFTAAADGFHAIGLTDSAPQGWQVSLDAAWTTPAAMETHTPEPEQAVYVWAGPYAAGTVFTAVYKVRVPLDAQLGAYTFKGSLEYRIESHPAPPYREPVGADVQIQVTAS